MEDSIVGHPPLHDEQSLTLRCVSVIQDSIGGPPAIALAEKDGQVVAIKLWRGDAETKEDTPLEKQPGQLVF